MPWNVENRRVWPATFRAGVEALMGAGARLMLQKERIGRKAPPKEIWMGLLQLLPRDWFAVVPPSGALPTPSDLHHHWNPS